MVVGFVIGPNFTVQTVLGFVTILSPIYFFAIGAIVKKGRDNTWRLVVYIVLNCIIAFTLGMKKVLISLINLSLFWGVNNLGILVGRTLASLCVGAFIGPVIIWYGLSKSGDIYIDNTLNTSEQQQELESFVGGALLILGGVASLACLGFLFLVKPHEMDVL